MPGPVRAVSSLRFHSSHPAGTFESTSAISDSAGLALTRTQTR
jgi:hypothetical protein